MTTRDAAGLAKLSLNILHRYLEAATELQALWIALAEKRVVITLEELAAARRAVDDVMTLELQTLPPGEAPRGAELVEQLRRMLEGLAAAAPGGGLSRGPK